MEYQKTAKGKLQKFQKSSNYNNSETVTNNNDIEIPKVKYISPKER